ncbi:MAG TPA: ATP-binding cassette domain-containing protein [Gammaproteobacteria bacterium]|nr:ATP-binding cassette domain-containing protein [Gammaproteobacteria bacterium]
MPLIRLQNIHLSYGEQPLLDGVDFTVEPGERVALLGRNGEGKSTLLKIIAGEVAVDDGEVSGVDSLRIAKLQQDVPRNLSGSVERVAADGLGEVGALIAEYHRVAADCEDDEAMSRLATLQSRIEALDGWRLEQRVSEVLSRLQLPAEAEVSTLSGGLARRVLLARALVTDPQLLLLDEPSNHLDIESIQWLEEFLLGSGLTLIFVTHDRAFLRRLATRIVDIDRGRLTSWPGDYDLYLQRKQAALEAEEKRQAEFDRKLAIEEAWIRQGIKARRTRNEGRVRALKKLREERRRRRDQPGRARIAANESAERSGKVVVEAENLAFSYDGEPVFRDFSTTILRGDRVGIIGPNGCGKSTLVRVLLGELSPDAGKLKLGTRLRIAYFDQLRQSLDPGKTALENVAGGSDSVTINGKSRHVISYLQDFLFSPRRARAPITRLSGGETNRLLLAKLFARPSNLLVLDEPTNDLDIETLELLEELLADYQGTVLLISHDREFIDRVATSSLVFESPGRIREYVGGYSDWLRQRPEPRSEAGSKQPAARRKAAPAPRKLSYKDQRELDALPETIEKLEDRQAEIHERMSDPAFYQQSRELIASEQAALAEIESALEKAYQRWEELDQMAGR